MSHTHSTIRDGKRFVWDTERLWSLSASFPPFEIEVDSIRELDADCWFEGKVPTLREVAKHCERINAAPTDRPIILNDDGSLMDGGHRLCRALIKGRKTVLAVQFPEMPEPDEIRELETKGCEE